MRRIAISRWLDNAVKLTAPVRKELNPA